MVKFLSLIFVCIVITDGVLCYQEGKRQVSESEPTASEFAIHVHLSWRSWAICYNNCCWIRCY